MLCFHVTSFNIKQFNILSFLMLHYVPLHCLMLHYFDIELFALFNTTTFVDAICKVALFNDALFDAETFHYSAI